MNVFIIDLSGKVLHYDESLCDSLVKYVDLAFVAHKSQNEGYHGKRLWLLRLIPKKMKKSESKVKRILKAVEGAFNYLLLIVYLLFKHPDILHFQWFPFMEFCSVDNAYISIVKFIKPRQKIVLTIHNVYPHDMSLSQKDKYRKRFCDMDKHIDKYIVHTESSKNEVANEFGVDLEKIKVVPHGIFVPDYLPQNKYNPQGKHIIMYGNNVPYKGTDILLDALQMLPEEYKMSVKLTVAGMTSTDYLNQLKEKSEGLNVTILPTYIPDQQLNEMIDSADFIALPYRHISQSGVLLLALYFKKPLIVADLPSFKETLAGFSDDMFFEAGNAESLCNLLMKYLNGEIDVANQIETISKLNNLYSWEESAQKTCALYSSIVSPTR